MEKVTQMCRICLESKDDMLSIYEQCSKDFTDPIFHMIMYCASVKIVQNDGLPELLCIECKGRLLTAFLFKRDCESSDFQLRQQIQNDYIFKNEGHHSSYFNDNESTTVIGNVKVEIPESDCFNFSNSEIIEKYNDQNNQEQSEEFSDKCIKEEQCLTENELSDVKPNVKFAEKVIKKVKRKRKKTEDDLLAHKYTCYVCCEVFLLKKEYDEHYSTLHLDVKYNCDFTDCTTEFTDYIKFIDHQKRDHNLLTNYVCPECQKSYNKISEFNRHIYNLHGVRSFGCLKCAKTFRTNEDLKYHTEKNHSDKYRCDICQKILSSSTTLSSHIAIMHNSELEKKYKCSQCYKVFLNQYRLNRHEGTVHAEGRSTNAIRKRTKNYLCSICGKKYIRPSDLTVHFRLHTGDKPYECKSCDYKTHDDHLLKSHLRKHTGDKLYKCRYCEKTFATSSYLIVHERFHSGYRPYKCRTCDKGFTNSSDLRIHERTHTGIKLYACEVCENRFTTLHYLKVHTKKHETGKILL